MDYNSFIEFQTKHGGSQRHCEHTACNIEEINLIDTQLTKETLYGARDRPGNLFRFYTQATVPAPDLVVIKFKLSASLKLSQDLLTLGASRGKVANHVESTLGEVITLTAENSLERGNGVLEVDELTLDTSEDLGNGEGLRQETLDLTGTLDSELIGLGKLVHTKNGNDILEGLVLLEDLLDAGGGVVVLLTDDTGVEHTGLGVEGIDGGVDTQLGDTTRQDSGGVQMGEGGGGGGISKIVSRHVDGLDGGNGTLGGGGDTLLHSTHVDGESGLVTDGRGDTAEKSGHLRTGLGEAENVVDEEQHCTHTHKSQRPQSRVQGPRTIFLPSCPSSSRKYSAIVRPVRATRARAPGGSFI